MVDAHIGRLGLAPDSVIITKYRKDIGEPEGLIIAAEEITAAEDLAEESIAAKKIKKNNVDLPQ